METDLNNPVMAGPEKVVLATTGRVPDGEVPVTEQASEVDAGRVQPNVAVLRGVLALT